MSSTVEELMPPKSQHKNNYIMDFCQQYSQVSYQSTNLGTWRNQSRGDYFRPGLKVNAVTTLTQPCQKAWLKVIECPYPKL